MAHPGTRMTVRAGKFIMLCLTSLMTGDVKHMRKVKIVITHSDQETQMVIDYLKRIEKGLSQ